MLEDELKDLLRDLCRSIGANQALIVHERADDGTYLPLGGGAYLRLAEPVDDDDRRVALERSVRAVRACGRRWGVDRLPVVGWKAGDALAPLEDRALARIEAYLAALCNMQHVVGAVVVRYGRIVAHAPVLSELQRERVPFLVKLVDAASAKSRESSHAEISGDDYFAASFYYGACMILFFEGAYSIDFVRHRARMVTRELSALLPMLDEPPPDPASSAPIPE